MERHAIFDSSGLPLAFFAEDVHGLAMQPIYGPAPEPTEEQPSPARPITGYERNAAIPEDAVSITDAQWLEFISNSGRRRWDGSKVVAYEPPPLPPVVPEVISDRQFAQALALAGTITEAEALAWAARGDLPEAMEEALDQIPDTDGQRFGARMMLAAATTYERHHPLSEQLGALLGYDPAALDALWTRAAAL